MRYAITINPSLFQDNEVATIEARKRLYQKGWKVTIDDVPIWTFDSEWIMDDFCRDFEEVRETVLPSPMWTVKYNYRVEGKAVTHTVKNASYFHLEVATITDSVEDC